MGISVKVARPDSGLAGTAIASADLVGGIRRIPYFKRVLATRPDALIGYWTLSDTSGTRAENLSNRAGMDGTYTGVDLGRSGIGDGRTSPYFDGTNDCVNVYSAGLVAAFNGAEGTLMAWVKVSGAAVWTDGLVHRVFTLRADGSNRIQLEKNDVNNTIQLYRAGGGTGNTVNIGSQSGLDWLALAITFSEAANELKSYINGVQQGVTVTGLGAWVGALAATQTVLGAGSTIPDVVWSGNIAHVALWSTPLTRAQIVALARV